jgi:hypothetical protein
MKKDFGNLPPSTHAYKVESRTLEPDFSSRLASADKWMRHYIANHPDQEGSNWVIPHKVFQCEVHELGSGELSEIVGTLKRLKRMDWCGLLGDGDLNCKELVGEPGKYTLHLSKSRRAVVGRDSRRLMLLVLCEKQ